MNARRQFGALFSFILIISGPGVSRLEKFDGVIDLVE